MSSNYQLLDSGHFQKLEQIGPYRLIRPAASAVWRPKLAAAEWSRYDARFERDRGGEGEWERKNKSLPEHWDIDVSGMKFRIRLTGFGHLGIFPEQEANWKKLRDLVKKARETRDEFRVLNLFAYTGGSSLFCAQGGAQVVHLDASKTSVSWARENAGLNDLSEAPIRWIVDDVKDFVAREVRRGSKYHGIILDPPSYGRGPKKQLWKIEEDLMPLLENLKLLMAEDFCFCLLSSHSQGYTPMAHQNQLAQMTGFAKATFATGEMLIFDEKGMGLPSGGSSLLLR